MVHLPFCQPCGKVAAPTWTAAQALNQAARNKKARNGQRRPTCGHPYRCPEGNGWHITTKPSAQDKGPAPRRGGRERGKRGR